MSLNKFCHTMHILVIFVFLVYCLMDSADSEKQKTVRLYQFKGKCPDHEDAPMFLKDVRFILSNRIYYVSFKRITKVNITDNLRLELTLNRCRGRESSDSCEKYQKIVVPHLCDLLDVGNKSWTPLLDKADSPMGCPIHAGVVTVTNGTFDGSALSHFPVSGWIWKVTANIFNERTRDLIFCLFLEGQIAPV